MSQALFECVSNANLLQPGGLKQISAICERLWKGKLIEGKIDLRDSRSLCNISDNMGKKEAEACE
jgi:hypothetical protein